MKKIFVLFSVLLLSVSAGYADMINPDIQQVCINKTGSRVSCQKYEASRQEYEVLKPFYKELPHNSYDVPHSYLLTGFKNQKGDVVIEPAFDYNKSSFTGRYMPVSQNKKYGLIDRQGNWVIFPQFDLLLPFSEGLAAACLNDKCGYVDEYGHWAIEPEFFTPMCYTYDRTRTYFHLPKCSTYSSSFSEGLAAVRYERTYKASVRIKEDEFKEYPIAPYEPENGIMPNQVYGEIKDSIFHIKQTQWDENLTYAEIYAQYKSGYINKQGNLVIKNFFGRLGAFSEGLAAAWSSKSNKYGYINKNGQYVIKPQFYEAGKFLNGIAEVTIYRPYTDRSRHIKT